MLLEDPGPACLVGGRGKAVTGERVVGRRCGGVKDGKGIDMCVEWSGMSTCVQRTDGMEHVCRVWVCMCGGGV